MLSISLPRPCRGLSPFPRTFFEAGARALCLADGKHTRGKRNHGGGRGGGGGGVLAKEGSSGRKQDGNKIHNYARNPKAIESKNRNGTNFLYVVVGRT